MSVAPTTGPGPNVGMGAVLQEDGCVFRTWAPFAESVSVVGSFTKPPWTVRVPLSRDNPAQGAGHDYWSVKVNGVQDRAEYKFISHRNGNDFWRLDPYCRDTAGAFDTAGNSVGNTSVVDDPAFDWADHHFRMPSWNELVIYELHIGTFNNDGDGKSGTFDQALEKLGKLAELGVNAIEVMPASGFESKTSMRGFYGGNGC
jgi:1,4-alpha-glucan branching enzyme